MNIQKYYQDLLNYQYLNGEIDEVEEFLSIAA
jgi:hypothetical protein